LEELQSEDLEEHCPLLSVDLHTQPEVWETRGVTKSSPEEAGE